MAKKKVAKKKVTRKKTKTKLPKSGDVVKLGGFDCQYVILDDLTKNQRTLLQKESAQMPAIVDAALMLGTSGGIPDPTDFEDYAETYQEVVWVYASTYSIANALAKTPIKLWKESKDKFDKLSRTEILSHPVLDLLWRPNQQDTWESLIEKTVVALELGGDAYTEIVTSKKPVLPIELYYMRPDRIEIVPAKSGKGIDRYIFKADEHTSNGIPFEADHVIHCQYHNPLDDWYGQGSATAASRAIVLEEYQERFCQRFFENNACPSGVLMTEHNITKENADIILKEWRAKYGGVDKAHKVAILPLGLKYEKIGSSLQEIGIAELGESTRDKIMTAFGVNDAVLGITKRLPRDVYRTQIRHFYEHTLVPKALKIANSMTNSLMPFYKDGEDLYLEFDFKDVLAEPYDVRLGRWERRFAIGAATPEEIVADLGGDIIKDTKLASMRFVDRKYVPLHLVEEASSKEPAPNNDVDDTKITEKLKKLIQTEIDQRDEENLE